MTTAGRPYKYQQRGDTPHARLQRGITDIVYRLIKERRMTNSEFARRIGFQNQRLSDRLYGRINWTLDDVYLIAYVLHLELTDLLPPVRTPERE